MFFRASRRVLMPLAAAGALVGCKTRAIELVAGPNADVRVVLVNPGTCPDCDPLAGVDSLRLDVVRDGTGQVLATDTEPWPGSSPTLPDLTAFGAVRVELRGYAGRSVVSVGRTAPFVVDPGQAADLPMLFLPANQPIALAADLVDERSRHVAFRRTDGRIALIGGVDPSGTARVDAAEVYDPDGFAFAPDAGGQPLPVGPGVNRLDDAGLLLVGGASASGSRQTTVQLYGLETPGGTGTLTPQADLPEPRAGACVARVGPQKGVVMGGVDPATGDSVVDVMRLGDAGWEFTRAEVEGLDNAAVAGCIGLDDGQAFVLGDTGAQTGFFRYDDTDGTPTFTPIASGAGEAFVRSAALRLLDDGRVWIVGGVRSSGQVAADTFVFDPDAGTLRAAVGLSVPRAAPDVEPWLDPDTAAVGCGWADAARSDAADGVELIDREAGTSTFIDLDRARPGCTLSVLPDGALLVAGGFSAADGGQVGAVLIAPEWRP